MLKKGQFYFFLTLLFLIALLAFFMALPFFMAIILAAALAVVCYHPYKWVIRVVRYESIAAILVIFLVALVLFIPLSFVGFQAVKDATNIYGNLSTHGIQDLQANPVVARIIARLPPDFLARPQDILKNALNWLIGSAGSLLNGTVSVFLNALIFIFALYYFLKDGRRLKDWIIKLTPLPDRYDNMILERLSSTVNAVVGGYLVISVLEGLLSGIGFTVFGVPNATLWGAIIAIASLVPAVGTTTVFVPAIAYLFLKGHAGPAIGLWIWWLLIVFFVENLLTPRLVNRGARIHPFVIFIAVLGGIGFFGPVGFLIGPLVYSLLFALLDIYVSLREKDKSG